MAYSFAKALRATRIRKQMTQEAVALACGWSGQSRVANYESETGKRQPKPNEIPLLAKALGVSVAELFGETPPPSERKSQPERTDFEKISSAAKVLLHYLELMGHPSDWVADPVMLEVAYQVVDEFGAPVVPDNVIDLTKVLAKRIRGLSEDERETVSRAGAAAGMQG